MKKDYLFGGRQQKGDSDPRPHRSRWRPPSLTEENFWRAYIPFALGFLLAYLFGALAHAMHIGVVS